jgi:hypothetical protein
MVTRKYEMTMMNLMITKLCHSVNRSRCLVTTDKHVNNTRDLARQLLCKRVPATTDTHATNEVLLETVFSVWFVLKYC